MWGSRGKVTPADVECVVSRDTVDTTFETEIPTFKFVMFPEDGVEVKTKDKSTIPQEPAVVFDIPSLNNSINQPCCDTCNNIGAPTQASDNQDTQCTDFSRSASTTSRSPGVVDEQELNDHTFIEMEDILANFSTQTTEPSTTQQSFVPWDTKAINLNIKLGKMPPPSLIHSWFSTLLRTWGKVCPFNKKISLTIVMVALVVCAVWAPSFAGLIMVQGKFLFLKILSCYQNSISFSERERYEVKQTAEFSVKDITSLLTTRFLEPENLVAIEVAMFKDNV